MSRQTEASGQRPALPRRPPQARTDGKIVALPSNYQLHLRFGPDDLKATSARPRVSAPKMHIDGQTQAFHAVPMSRSFAPGRSLLSLEQIEDFTEVLRPYLADGIFGTVPLSTAVLLGSRRSQDLERAEELRRRDDERGKRWIAELMAQPDHMAILLRPDAAVQAGHAVKKVELAIRAALPLCELCGRLMILKLAEDPQTAKKLGVRPGAIFVSCIAWKACGHAHPIPGY
jgi:hypothetical protein